MESIIKGKSINGLTNMKSGIPQGVLAIFINDLPDKIESTTMIFADNTNIFREVTNHSDQDKLQEDLNTLSDWYQIATSTKQMQTS